MSGYFEISAFPSAMLQNAEWQLEQHQYAAAIILAQVAVEMTATEIFTTLIGRRIGLPVDPAGIGRTWRSRPGRGEMAS
jgi:hypothetical protein